MKPRRGVRIIAGVRFLREDDGHYYSEDRRFGLLHILRGTPQVSWLLKRLGADGQSDESIYDATWLFEIQQGGERGYFSLDTIPPKSLPDFQRTVKVHAS